MGEPVVPRLLPTQSLFLPLTLPVYERVGCYFCKRHAHLQLNILDDKLSSTASDYDEISDIDS